MLNPSQQDEFETIKFNYESYKNNNKSVVMCKSIHNDTDKYLAFDDDNVYFMKGLIKINMWYVKIKRFYRLFIWYVWDLEILKLSLW